MAATKYTGSGSVQDTDYKYVKYVGKTKSGKAITIEMENRIFDIGYIFNIGGLKEMVGNLSKAYSTNFSSMWRTYERIAENALQKLNDALFKPEQ